MKQYLEAGYKIGKKTTVSSAIHVITRIDINLKTNAWISLYPSATVYIDVYEDIDSYNQQLPSLNKDNPLYVEFKSTQQLERSSAENPSPQNFNLFEKYFGASVLNKEDPLTMAYKALQETDFSKVRPELPVYVNSALKSSNL